jgi:hypothetical protein
MKISKSASHGPLKQLKKTLGGFYGQKTTTTATKTKPKHKPKSKTTKAKSIIDKESK